MRILRSKGGWIGALFLISVLPPLFLGVLDGNPLRFFTIESCKDFLVESLKSLMFRHSVFPDAVTFYAILLIGFGIGYFIEKKLFGAKLRSR